MTGADEKTMACWFASPGLRPVVSSLRQRNLPHVRAPAMAREGTCVEGCRCREEDSVGEEDCV